MIISLNLILGHERKYLVNGIGSKESREMLGNNKKNGKSKEKLNENKI